jgi:hypothetical protein
MDSVADDLRAEATRLGLSACEYVEAVLTLHARDEERCRELERLLKLYR